MDDPSINGLREAAERLALVAAKRAADAVCARKNFEDVGLEAARRGDSGRGPAAYRTLEAAVDATKAEMDAIVVANAARRDLQRAEELRG